MTSPHADARSSAPGSDAVLLNVNELTVTYGRGKHLQPRPSVDRASFTIDPGEVVAVVGESGSGKSTLGRTIMGLNDGSMATGTLEFAGRSLLGLSERDWKQIRGNKISMIFQEAQAALTPTQTVGRQLRQAVRLSQGVSNAEAQIRQRVAFDEVGLPSSNDFAAKYPFELSGGMCQRVLIAIALINSPDLVIADEPTSALDVTVQRKVLDTLDELIADRGSSLLLISHDLGVVAERSDRVVVMSGGRCVEQGDTATVFASPQDSATVAMIQAVTRRDAAMAEMVLGAR